MPRSLLGMAYKEIDTPPREVDHLFGIKANIWKEKHLQGNEVYQDDPISKKSKRNSKKQLKKPSNLI